MRPLLFLIPLTLAAQQPDAHWSFDGATPAARLTESYGRSSLDAAESNGTSSWTTRPSFGDILANSNNTPYLSVPQQAAIDPGSGDFSISLWSYRSSDDALAAGLLDALNGTGTGYQLFYQGDGTLRIRLDDAAGNTLNADTSASHLALNTWKNIIVTVDRSTDRVRFYIDGNQVAPLGGIDISALSAAIFPDQSLQIGTLNANTSAKGHLDDLAFFKRLLTPAEITAINTIGGTPILTVFPAGLSLPVVSLFPPSGILHAGESITLSSDPAAEIRYTLDGSAPDAMSTLYTAPFTLAASATVTARSIDGSELGPLSSATYLRLPATPPKVLLIVADDLGFNDLSCYGAVTVHTPRLDALARGGQRFTQFTTTGPGDLASQYSLLTGRLARRGGLPALASPATAALDSREWTLGEAFRKSGYQTAFIGTWHLGDLSGSKATDQGFQLFHGLPWAPTLSPAPPLIENSITLDPAPSASTLLATLTTRAETFIAAHAAQPFLLVFQPPSLPASGTSLLGAYGNQIEALDAATGRLLDQLQSSGITNDTLVLFLSDGGANKNTGSFPTGSNGQQRDGKGTTWEGGVHVPAIARWPGVIPAADNFAVLWLPDLYHSLAEIIDAYLPPDRPLDGTARTDVLLGARTAPDDTTTLYLHRHTGSGYALQALRSGKWKYHQASIKSDPDNDLTGSAPFLFDLEVDPIEHVNRSSTETAVLSSLQQAATVHEATFATPIPQLPLARDEILGPVETSFPPGSGTTATFSFVRPTDSLNDHYILQTGNDLAGWTDLAIDPYVTITPGPGETEALEVSVPLDVLGGLNPRFFVRLRAIRP